MVLSRRDKQNGANTGKMDQYHHRNVDKLIQIGLSARIANYSYKWYKRARKLQLKASETRQTNGNQFQLDVQWSKL